MRGLANSKLDRVRGCLNQCRDGTWHILNSREESGLIEKAVVDSNIEAALSSWIEEAIIASDFHYEEINPKALHLAIGI